MNDMKIELRADNLYKSYKKRDVVKDVSIKIEQRRSCRFVGS